MTDSEVLDYKNFAKDQVLLCCETISSNRFIIKQVSLKNGVVTVTLTDGTTVKPPILKEIQGFKRSDVKQAQRYLLKL